MSNYTKERADAAKEIKANGYAFKIVKPGVATTDPVTLKVEKTSVELDVFGVEFEFDFRDIDGTNVQRGDLRIMASALNDAGVVIAEPKSDDVFRVEGQKDRLIVNVEAFRPGGYAIYYWLQVRG